MKKVLSMVALGSMLFGLSACSSEEQEIEQATSGNVFVKLENVVGPSSRMTEPAKTESDATEFHNGFLIFGTPKSAIRKRKSNPTTWCFSMTSAKARTSREYPAM